MEPFKPVSPWLRSLAIIVAMPIALPLYCAYAGWIGHLIIHAPWDAPDFGWQGFSTLGFMTGLFGGIVEFFLPQPRSWMGYLTRRQAARATAVMVAALILLPVGLSLLLRYY